MSEVEYELLPSANPSQVGVVLVAAPASEVRVVGEGRFVAVWVEPPWQTPLRNARAVWVGQDQSSVEPWENSPSGDSALGVVIAQFQLR